MTAEQREEAVEPTGLRHRFRRNPALNLTYRVGVGVVGGLVLLGGILMIPYPGPGWLVVFAGLAILATEFAWAGRLLRFAKRYYDAWVAWLKRQNVLVKALVLSATALVVAATCWLLGAFALVGGWFGLEWPWLGSPIFGSRG
ncbi:TIGR02611 family protein [Saccharothrix obliqua]|uniref:TIGR02611 family protein n=1 Tax=Saccharothrix obliqua TaxID=2861747 RepID=UPI001C5F2967|nr:TIGR02611 family protein [Saccharothrix obliqua]MBW4721331.1 TIGR02611 family protein [Saccharothrix obliqua]